MVVSIVLEMMVTPLRGGGGERAESGEGGDGCTEHVGDEVGW